MKKPLNLGDLKNLNVGDELAIVGRCKKDQVGSVIFYVLSLEDGWIRVSRIIDGELVTGFKFDPETGRVPSLQYLFPCYLSANRAHLKEAKERAARLA